MEREYWGTGAGYPKKLWMSHSLLVFKARLYGALSNLILLSIVRRLNSIVLKMPFNPNNFMILWLYDEERKLYPALQEQLHKYRNAEEEFQAQLCTFFCSTMKRKIEIFLNPFKQSVLEWCDQSLYFLQLHILSANFQTDWFRHQ